MHVHLRQGGRIPKWAHRRLRHRGEFRLQLANLLLQRRIRRHLIVQLLRKLRVLVPLFPEVVRLLLVMKAEPDDCHQTQENQKSLHARTLIRSAESAITFPGLRHWSILMREGAVVGMGGGCPLRNVELEKKWLYLA